MGRFIWTADSLEELHIAHAAGLSDRAIAEKIGCSRNGVSKRRASLGMSFNSDQGARAMRTALLAQVSSKGAGAVNASRWGELDEEIARRGWPRMPLRCVLVIEYLCDFGPKEKGQLSSELGLPPRMPAGKSYVASVLLGHELIHRVGALRVVGQRRFCVYFPTARAMDIRHRFLESPP